MKPIVTVRGTRILVTPSSDAELPEPERRVFQFLNPSVRTWDRFIDESNAAAPDQARSPTLILIHRLLRGWSNVSTEDAAVAAAYKLEAIEGPAAVPYPANVDVKPNLFDVLSLVEWREVSAAVIGAINPGPSGN